MPYGVPSGLQIQEFAMRRFRQMIKPVLNATRLWFLGLVLALGASLAPYASAAETTQPKKIITIEGITEYQLENGLRLLLLPDPSSPRITVNMTVLVGSRHEGYGETGMAHLLEHMLFKGTPTHANIFKALRDRGADFNGITTADR